MKDIVRRGPFLLAVVVVAAAVAFNVVSWRQDVAERQVASDREAALRVASQAVPQLLSYDQKSVDKQMASTAKLLTSAFRPRFAELQKTLIEPSVKEAGLTTTASVERIGVVSSRTGRVEVLVFLAQTTTKAGRPADHPIATRASVVMRKVNGSWYVDDLRPT